MRERDGERNSDREMFWRRRKIERERDKVKEV